MLVAAVWISLLTSNFLAISSGESLPDYCNVSVEPAGIIPVFANSFVLTCDGGKTNTSTKDASIDIFVNSIRELKRVNKRRVANKLIFRNLNVALTDLPPTESVTGFELDAFTVDNCTIRVISHSFFLLRVFTLRSSVTFTNVRLSSSAKNSFNLKSASLNKLSVYKLVTQDLMSGAFDSMFIQESINISLASGFEKPFSMSGVQTKTFIVDGNGNKHPIILHDMTVSRLHVMNAVISSLNGVFVNKTSLYQISISNSTINEPLNDSFLASVYDITEKLVFFNTSIKDFPSFPRRQFHLKEIHLVNCQIQSIDFNIFRNLQSLEYLNLSGNLLSSLGPSWNDIASGVILNESLKYLSLRNNLLTRIPYVPVKDLVLTLVELGGNPLICDCSNLWLTSENASSVFLSDNLTCDGPTQLKGRNLRNLSATIDCSTHGSKTTTSRKKVKNLTTSQPQTKEIRNSYTKSARSASSLTTVHDITVGGSSTAQVTESVPVQGGLTIGGSDELIAVMVAAGVILLAILLVFLLYKFRNKLFTKTSNNRGKYRRAKDTQGTEKLSMIRYEENSHSTSTNKPQNV